MYGGAEPWQWTLGLFGARLRAGATGRAAPTERAHREQVLRLTAHPRLPHLLATNEFFVRLAHTARTDTGVGLDRWWSRRTCNRRSAARRPPCRWPPPPTRPTRRARCGCPSTAGSGYHWRSCRPTMAATAPATPTGATGSSTCQTRPTSRPDLTGPADAVEADLTRPVSRGAVPNSAGHSPAGRCRRGWS